MPTKMIIAIDIDGTLCKEQEDWWNYDTAIPIEENIEKVRSMFRQGNQIVLYTSRFEEDRKVTERWLKRHNVPHHNIIFGKFRADVYVDERAKRMEEL